MAVSETQESRPLEYGCSEWRRSSQIASNLFNDGCKLWTKNDLRDIEQQLTQSQDREVFRVRAINGTSVLIRNPMFGERLPIWEPRVKYQEYWRLVKMQPDGPAETYHCSYLVDWVNISMRRFRGIVENSKSVFEENRLIWNKSMTCKSLKSQLEKVALTKKATKILCFGLGDICRKSPDWMRRQSDLGEHELEAGFNRSRMIQHSIALTMAEICRHHTGSDVQLLAQDPDYTEQAKEILREYGFSIVGQFGAGGFAEIDDNSIVFSAFVEAPLKQIIADIARPPMITSAAFWTFNNSE